MTVDGDSVYNFNEINQRCLYKGEVWFFEPLSWVDQTKIRGLKFSRERCGAGLVV